MSAITELAAIIGKASVRRGDKMETGRVSGSVVVVNGRSYRPIWGGDFDVADGDTADCVIDGNKCIVMRCQR